MPSPQANLHGMCSITCNFPEGGIAYAHELILPDNFVREFLCYMVSI